MRLMVLLTGPMRLRVSIGLMLLFLRTAVAAQDAHYSAKFAPVLDDNINGFWEYLPRNYDTDLSETYPLLVYMHGAGDMGTQQDVATMEKVNRNGPAKLMAKGSFPEMFQVGGKNFRFIMIAPQIKNGANGGSSIIDPATIDAVVEYAKSTYRVDMSRIYIAGMSMGGGATWVYAASPGGAKKIAAIAVAAGAGDISASGAANIAAEHVAVLATHNTVDGTVPYQRTVANIGRIETAIQSPPSPVAVYWTTPGQHNPQESDNGEHNVWTRTFEDILPGTTAGGNLRDTLGINVYEWMLGFTNESIVPAPVIWDEITAVRSNGLAQVTWKVSAQTAVREYVVERSTNNRTFLPVGVIPAQAEVNEMTYFFADKAAPGGQVFYRIRQVNNDDDYAYSAVRLLVADDNHFAMAVYPNPFTESVFLTIPATDFQPLDLRITDMQGRLLKVVKITTSANPVFVGGLAALAKGTYVLTLTDSKGSVVFSQKMIKL